MPSLTIFFILSVSERKVSQRTLKFCDQTQKASLRNKNQTVGLALNRVSFTTEQGMEKGKP